MGQRSAAGSLVVLVGLAAAGCEARVAGETAEHTGTSRSALDGSGVQADGDGPNERIIVALANKLPTGTTVVCNGTLLTTRIILTAAHCFGALAPDFGVAILHWANADGVVLTTELPISASSRLRFVRDFSAGRQG